MQNQLSEGIATLSQAKESVPQEKLLPALDILSQPKALTQDLLLSLIAALSNPQEQVDDLIAIAKEMFAAMACIAEPEPNILRLDQVSSFIDWIQGRLKLRKPGKAIGETGLGKTCACHACLEEFEPVQHPNQPSERPFVYVQIDENRCAPGRFLQLILIALRKPTSGNLHQLKQRVKKFFKQYKVQILLVDEAHCLHFDALKTARSFYDDKDLGVIPILIGTSNRLDTLMEKDEQVNNRFANTFVFEELAGDKFSGVVKIWGEKIIRMQDPLISKDPSKAGGKKRIISLLKTGKAGINKDLASTLEEMTSGELRLLDNILRDAAVRLLEKKLGEIYSLVLQALKTDSKVLAFDAKKILKEIRIDKSFLQSMKGEYLRGRSM
ncbi:MAG: ATP-binding protein [Lyngbya sp. HA4199-MV5]|nr:ATP-binding protein [Lyngbya sp. HA4199-MV5]